IRISGNSSDGVSEPSVCRHLSQVCRDTTVSGPVYADVGSCPRVDTSARVSARVRGVRDHGGSSVPHSEDSEIGGEIGHFVDDRHYSQSHFRVGIWCVLCRCSRVDAAGCQLSLADAQAIPLGRTRKRVDDGCLRNAQKLALRTVASGATSPQTRSPHEYVSLWICRKNQSKEKKSWQQQRRPPAPLSRLSHATALCKRCASLKMLGILAILQR